MEKMVNHKYISHLISVKLKGWKAPLYGFILDLNKDWTLIKYNPVDYLIDGYKIIRNKYIESIQREDEEKWREKVIRLKGISPNKNEKIPISNLSDILEYLTKTFNLFEIQKKYEDSVWIGRLKKIDSKNVVIKDVTPKGKWDGQMEFKRDEIRLISFETDYI